MILKTAAWIYKGCEFDQTPEEYQGFVYIIHNTAHNRFYIGKKNFWQTKKLPPLKGRKNKRHKRVQSDWHTYWGSNTALQQAVASLGESNFSRTILHLCRTKTDMSYHETRLQFQQRVLESDTYYNEFIGCRITARGLTLT